MAANATHATSAARNTAGSENNLVHLAAWPPHLAARTAPAAASDSHASPLCKIITLNIAGLLPYNYRGKVQLLGELALTENAFLISLTETHLTHEISDAEIKIPNFIPFRTDRPAERKKGGVITYVDSRYAAGTRVLHSESNLYTECLALYLGDLDWLYINVYRPPACPRKKFIDQLIKIKHVINSLPPPMPTIILTGDLNFPLIDWESETVYGGSAEMRIQAESVLSLAEDYCLHQVVNTPTRGGNILDVVMTNNGDLVRNVSVNKTNLSDHNLITLTTSLSTDMQTRTDMEAGTSQHEPYFDQLNFHCQSICWESIKRDLADVNWESLMNNSDPEVQHHTLMRKCLEITQKYVPQRRVSNKGPLSKGNIPRDRKLLMRKRTKLRNKLKVTTNLQATTQIENKIIAIEEELKQSIEMEGKKKEMQAVACIKNNPKYFYKYAASKSIVRARVGPLTDSDGRTVHEAQEVVEVLLRQYESAFSTPRKKHVIDSPEDFFRQIPDCTSQLTDIPLNRRDIEEAINEISNNSAAGPDHFPAVLLRHCATELSVPLLSLYKNSLQCGIIPKPLKCARITPIHKGGSKMEAKNYRPVALTSHITKVLERIIAKNMAQYLEENNLMNKDQHGFRTGRSCLSQLLAHYETILEKLEHNKSVDVVYLDFAKAFDKVDHGILLQKARDIGITGKLGIWLHSFLTNRQQCVAADGAVSHPSAVISGVPQGSVLGPLLFLIHISDINQRVMYSSIASFADDTKVMKEFTTGADIEQLQGDLQSLYSWGESNNMLFNNNKFEHMHYNPGGTSSNVHVFKAPDNTPIETKHHTRDLGIILSCDGNFTQHVHSVVKKARSQAGWILRTFRTRERLPMLTLYKSLIIPLLEYCCQLWSPWRAGEKQMLESVQRSFTSRISGVQHLDYWGRLRELNLYSLERRRERYAILYIFKILTGKVINNLNIQFIDHQRRGRLCHIKRTHPRASTRIKTLKENSFAARGPYLFNALPRHMRDSTENTLENFKKQLDKFLQSIPDQPKLPHYHLSAASNSITDHLAKRRADGLY